MLFYVEQGVDFTCAYGDISEGFYTSMINMFYQVAKECDRDEELYKAFSSRLYQVVTTAPVGWGFREALFDAYYTVGWVFEEDDKE
jgi:hypothetical protein